MKVKIFREDGGSQKNIENRINTFMRLEGIFARNIKYITQSETGDKVLARLTISIFYESD